MTPVAICFVILHRKKAQEYFIAFLENEYFIAFLENALKQANKPVTWSRMQGLSISQIDPS